MQVEVKTLNLVRFMDIPIGGVFRFKIDTPGTFYYIKTNDQSKNNNTLSLISNEAYTTNFDAKVISVKAKIVIED